LRSISTTYARSRRLAQALATNGMPTIVGSVTREHIESYIGDLLEA
jgi:hypothetical protein